MARGEQKLMKRLIWHLAIGGILAFIGAAGTACDVSTALPADLRPPPAILGSGTSTNPLMKRFSVDLRRYPETRRISWDFGDGGMSTNLSVQQGREVTHEFAGTGVFTVQVHLFQDAGIESPGLMERIATGSLPVEVRRANVSPTAFFVVNDVRDSAGVLLPRSRRFDGTRSTDADGVIATYTWDFGDGAGGTGASVEHAYASSGRFLARLTVTDDRGGTASTTRTVFVNVTPVAAFESQVTDDPGGLTVRFDAGTSTDADGDELQFRWNFGDGSPEETGQIVTHTYEVPGTRSVTLRVVDSAGAVSTFTRSVHVSGRSLFVRSAAPSDGEVGTSANLVINGENFLQGATVRLVRAGSPTINATSVQLTSARQLAATFSLIGAALGDYAVVVENPGGTTARLEAGFRVVTANRVRLKTSQGEILLELVDDAPITTANFLQYVNDRFYDGTIFHRVVPGFVVQGGGLLPGGAPQTGIRPPIQNEFSPNRSNVRATVAMAKLGGDPDSATSQFFFNLADNSANLDNQNGGFTVFARVVEGMDVVDAIAAVPLSGERPITDVVLTTARRE